MDGKERGREGRKGRRREGGGNEERIREGEGRKETECKDVERKKGKKEGGRKGE